ncbi:hypothetical protein HI914_07430 [Erysiphe necator]|nr:hypothetical protein HI914_07430 [Erysiphe necator]
MGSIDRSINFMISLGGNFLYYFRHLLTRLKLASSVLEHKKAWRNEEQTRFSNECEMTMLFLPTTKKFGNASMCGDDPYALSVLYFVIFKV